MMRYLLVLCLLATPALADDRVKAKALYDEGTKLYNVADYPGAIAKWKESYLLSKKPFLLFNISQAYRLSGDCTQAMTFYDSYEREETGVKNSEELEAGKAECKTKLAVQPPTPPEKPPEKPKVPRVPEPPGLPQPEADPRAESARLRAVERLVDVPDIVA